MYERLYRGEKEFTLYKRFTVQKVYRVYELFCEEEFAELLPEKQKKLNKLVNHSPSARDLQAFLLFSQHPAWVITPVNP